MTPADLAAGREPEALARLVHDLRSPLAVIRGLCFALQREEARPAHRRHLELIDGEVDRITHGLERLLAPARPPVAGACLVSLVASAVERHRPAAARRGAALTLRAPHAPMSVRADADDVRRILDNLIGNALRHSPEGGQVRLSIRRRAALAAVTVRDGGPGVPAADRERIFVAGDRGTAPVGEGHGLGLAICRDLAHRHGGSLELASRGPGAAFRLVLPLAVYGGEGSGAAA